MFSQSGNYDMERLVFEPTAMSRLKDIKKQSQIIALDYSPCTCKQYTYMSENENWGSRTWGDPCRENNNNESFESSYAEDPAKGTMASEEGTSKLDEEMRMDTTNESDMSADSMSNSPAVINKKRQILQRIVSLKRSLRRGFGVFKYAMSTRKMLDVSSTHKSTGISAEDIEDVWREVALCHLLTIIEIPFLDGLLEHVKEIKKANLRRSSSNVSRKSFIDDSDHYNTPDLFCVSALDCIQGLQKNKSLANESVRADEIQTYKMHLFKVVGDLYKGHSKPLLPQRFEELHLATLDLVLRQRDDSACKVLQLEMLLLDWQSRDELHRLLKFMAAAATDESVTLNPEETNESVVLNTFTDIILKHKVLSRGIAAILTGLMMCNVDNIFTVPKELREAVDVKLRLMQKGDNCAPVQDPTFCSRVTSEEYNRQTQECTEVSLCEMVNKILDDTDMSSKVKKQWLYRFKVCHPCTYAKHFSDRF